MKAKKSVTLALLAAMLATASCGSSGTSETTTAPSGETTAPAETTSLYESDELPELDFGGEDFTIFVQDYGGYCGRDFFVEEATGDIVDDAVFKKNAAVADRLNLNIKHESITHDWNGRDEFYTLIRSSVMAGDGAYDLMHAVGYFVPSFVTDGVLLDMSTLPYIDIDKPWWSAKFMENAAVDGKYYFVTGDAALGLIKNMYCIFENLDLAESVGLAENPYELVKSGNWTLDKLSSLIKDCYGDLNGNTEPDKEDRFGLLLNSGNHFTGFIEPCEVDIVEFDGKEPKFVFGNERGIEAVERLCKLTHENEGAFFDETGEQETAYQSIFRNENVVFATGWLMHTDSYRDLNWDYGVLPYPKWDESQEEYKTTVLTTYSVLSIPADCKNPDRAAAVCEALGSESYRTVTPAYFETALKVKYSRDNESAQMFDIIRDGIDFNFGYIYTSAMNGISDQFKNAIEGNNPDWASKTEGIKASTQDKLDELVEAIRNVAD